MIFITWAPIFLLFFVIINFMSLSIGIVGLPNVGKSTLFNALLKRQAALVANYPFDTIEPNIGVVDVPDYRLNGLVEVVKNEKEAQEKISLIQEHVSKNSGDSAVRQFISQLQSGSV